MSHPSLPFPALSSALNLSYASHLHTTGSHFSPVQFPSPLILAFLTHHPLDFYCAYCLSSQMALTTHHAILLFVLKVFPVFSSRLYFAWGLESFVVCLSILSSPEQELACIRNSVAAAPAAAAVNVAVCPLNKLGANRWPLTVLPPLIPSENSFSPSDPSYTWKISLSHSR